MPGNELISSHHKFLRSSLRYFLNSVLIGIIPLVSPNVYGAESDLGNADLLSQILSEVKAHYFRPLSPAELNPRSLDELFSMLDQETHLELVKPSSLDFVRGLEDENSISEIGPLRQNLGYLRIAFFGRRTPNDLNQALLRLQKLGIKNLILDLRGNSGGSLESGVGVIERFVPPGKLLFTYQGRDPVETKRFSQKGAETISLGGIFVLIDGKAASTAEIVADSLRRYAKAQLIGEPTRGKKSIQEPFPVSPSHVLFLTVGHFRLPRESPSGKIGPDDLVPPRDALKKAIALVKKEDGVTEAN